MWRCGKVRSERLAACAADRCIQCMTIRVFRSQRDPTWFAAADDALAAETIPGSHNPLPTDRLPYNLAPWLPVEGATVPLLAGETPEARDERVSRAVKADGRFLFRSTAR